MSAIWNGKPNGKTAGEDGKKKDRHLRRFDRQFQRLGIPRFRVSSGVSKKPTKKNDEEFIRRNGIISKLAANGQRDVLLALMREAISIEYLVDLDRKGTLSSATVLADAKLDANLWVALDDTLSDMGPQGVEKRGRYRTSRNKFVRYAAHMFGNDPIWDLAQLDWRMLDGTVRDLAEFDWGELEGEWEGSAADWNHLRRYLSRFLTVYLGDKYHAFARELRPKIPTRNEGKGRVPDISPEFFLQIVSRTPEHAWPCYWCLVLTGFRTGEYLSRGKEHLMPRVFGVEIPPKDETKTDDSADVVYIHPDMWHWIEDGIPSPLQYKWMRIHFKRAVRELAEEDAAERGLSEPTPKIAGLHLHDLRHCYGQWAANLGAVLPALQSAMRHSDPAMTMRYIRQVEKGTVGNLVGQALMEAKAPLRRVK